MEQIKNISKIVNTRGKKAIAIITGTIYVIALCGLLGWLLNRKVNIDEVKIEYTTSSGAITFNQQRSIDISNPQDQTLGYLFAACYYEGQKCDDKNDIIWSVQLTNYPVAYASKALPEWIDSDLDQTGQFNVNFKALDPSEYVVDQDGLGQYDFRITAAAKYSKATLDWYTFNILLTGATPSR